MTTPAGPGLAVHELCAGWGERRVLEDVSLEFGAGQTSCILGPGGSGKSTLLWVLDRFLSRSPSGTSGKEGGQPWWTGELYTAFDAGLHLPQRATSCDARIADLLVAAGLRERLEHWLPSDPDHRRTIQRHLGVGFDVAPKPVRRYVGLVLAQLSANPVLLIDEPLFGLDREWAQTITAKLRQLAEGERTLVIVTHYLPLARELGDHVTLMVDGVVVESAAKVDFFDRPKHLRTQQFLQWGG